jgi:hypothetical protein
LAKQTHYLYRDAVPARQYASQLLQAVLHDETKANEALTYWPLLVDGSKKPLPTQDPSLQVAYHLLWHFECDQGMSHNGYQQTELFYMDVQFELLKQVAKALQDGHPLSQDILACLTHGVGEEGAIRKPLYFKWKPLAQLGLRECCTYGLAWVKGFFVTIART